MSAVILRGDARQLPLPDESADLIVTSPPYFGQRDYRDGGESMAGQIGSEDTPAEYIASLLDCMREWIRVLKPSGSIFLNIGDKYSQRTQTRRSSHQPGIFPGKFPEFAESWAERAAKSATRMPHQNVIGPDGGHVAEKSLMGLPWRVALACTDELGLILRRDIIWHKVNGLPESVTDRCRSSHEYLFHFTRQPRYYSAVDEIREATAAYDGKTWSQRKMLPGANPGGHAFGLSAGSATGATVFAANPLGKLPGSVWDIPSQPLIVPPHLGISHFAAFPLELPRRIILGWSPPGVCLECGEGRRPVAHISHEGGWTRKTAGGRHRGGDGNPGERVGQVVNNRQVATLTGYACACTPFTDHPERRSPTVTPGRALGRGHQDNDLRAALGTAGTRHHGNDWPQREPVREYDFNGWTPPPTRPAVILDPFAGTGTTMLAASVLGRTGIGVDRSADYCRLARWRCSDPGERAKAMQVPKPPVIPDGQLPMFAEGF